jgi:Uma2 family endonuclease
MALSEEVKIGGDVIATDTSFDDYMEKYAEDHTEWIEGMVIKLSPVTRKHDLIDGFFYLLLRIFLNRTGLGIVLRSPFVMKITPESSGREPDLQVILKEHAGIIQETMTAGAADVVIEIVSKESQNRDLVEKYEEYEAGGVSEYWLINPLRKQSDFYGLGEDNLYQRIELRDGVFHSKVLPNFSLNTDLLWDDAFLQDDNQIQALVDSMLKKDE